MYKMLIVDDEYESRNGLFKYFPWSEAGFEVVGQAGDGLEAVEFIKANPVDIVLCDIMMPRMTGIELAEYLSGEYPCIKVCFFTAYRDFNFAQKAVSLGAVQYVLKSSTSKELLEEFRHVKAVMDDERTRAKTAILETQPQSETNDEENRVISEIKRYVSQNYATADLEELADVIYMSASYIGKMFKKKTGQNFSDYLISCKMEKAAALLGDMRYKIYEVSEAVGYKYVKNFSRTFREYYGVSPREYRDCKPPRAHCGDKL